MSKPIRLDDPIDRSSPIPAYQQVATSLTARIAQEEWCIGEKLPSENALAEEYHVSRVTIRQALALLNDSGAIEKMQGIGVFVTDNPHFTLQELQLPGNESQPIMSPDIPLLSTNIHIEELFEADRHAARMLRVPQREPMVYLERCFEKEGRVVGIYHAWFSSAKVPGMAAQGLIDRSVSKTLHERYHYSIESVENYIESITLDLRSAQILASEYAAPALKIDTVHMLADGVPIAYSSTIWDGRNTKFHIKLSSGT